MSVGVYRITLSNGDWFCVFAHTSREALGIVQSNHFPDVSMKEFKQQERPVVKRVPDDEELLVDDEEFGQHKWTAKKWAAGEGPGLFCSNTYEG